MKEHTFVDSYLCFEGMLSTAGIITSRVYTHAYVHAPAHTRTHAHTHTHTHTCNSAAVIVLVVFTY